MYADFQNLEVNIFSLHINDTDSRKDVTYVCMYREWAGLYQRVDTDHQRAHTPSPSDSQF